MKNKVLRTWGITIALATSMALTGCAGVSGQTLSATETQASSVSDSEVDENTDPSTEATGVTTSATTTLTPATIAAIGTLDLDNQFSDKDKDADWDAASATAIALEGTTASVKGSGASVDGTTITITEPGTYVVSGELKDGQIRVETDAQEKVHLVLNGASITNDDSACILALSTDKLIITLADGTENSLSDTGAAFTQTDASMNVDGVIYAEEDLSFNGKGSLTVKAGTAHGIVTKDDLVITGGTYTIDAAAKGLVGNDSVRISDGTFTVTSTDDAIHTGQTEKEGKGYIYIEGGTFTLASGDDGIHAATSLIIAGGSIDVTQSYEGIEGATIDILDGDIRVKASDDALNAAYSTTSSDAETERDFGGRTMHENMTPPEGMENMTPPEGMENMTPPEGMENMTPPEGMGNGTRPEGGRGGMRRGGMQGQAQGGMQDNAQGSMQGGMRGGMMDAQTDVYLRIAGGNIYLDAGGDGLDSNGNLLVEGGTIYVDGPTNNGNGSLDYGLEATITGGTILAAGSAGMAESFSDSSTQAFASYTFDSVIAAGTKVTVTDSTGKEIISATPAKEYQNVIFSTPALTEGEYTITAGEMQGTAQWITSSRSV